MARYGENKYGTVKYGITTRAGLSWSLEIDWLSTGSYNGNNDAQNMISLSVKRGRDNMIKTDGKGFEPIKEGTFTATLLNMEGQYNPYKNAYIRSGANFRLRVRDDSGSTIYPIMTGQIDDIRPIHDEIEKVMIQGSDRLRNLKNVTPLVDLQENKTRDTIFPLILDSINWTSGCSIQSLVEMPETIPFWWASEKNAFDTLKELSDSALGQIFIAGDGQFKFYALSNGTYGSAVATISGSDILKDYSILQPWDVQRNSIDVVVNNFVWASGSIPILDTNPVEIFKLENTSILLPYDASLVTILTKPTYNNKPFIVYDTIASPTNIFTSGSDGSGSNLSPYFAMGVDNFGYLLELQLGNVISLVTGSNINGYLTYLIIKGHGLVKGDVYSIESIIQANIDKYGRKEFVLDNPWIQELLLANYDANSLQLFFSGSLIFPTIKIMDKPTKQFFDLFDIVHLDIADLYINDEDNYYISSIQHDWETQTGDIVTTTLGLEPVIPFIF